MRERLSSLRLGPLPARIKKEQNLLAALQSTVKTAFKEQKLEAETLLKEDCYALILCGRVRLNGHVEKNPKAVCQPTARLEILAEQSYVSRGGLKLQAALKHFNIKVKDAVVLDAGSSTGGFCDCLLQHGARYVYAVDSGQNQLDYRLRQDPRIAVFENTKIQDFFLQFPFLSTREGKAASKARQAHGKALLRPDFATMDIAFRSIINLLKPCLELCRQGIFLCKPQFEWQHYAKQLNENQQQQSRASFHGILEPELAEEVYAWFRLAVQKQGLTILGELPSPILGSRGNREYFLHLAF